MRAPIGFVYGNCVFADALDDGWAAFAVQTESYEWLSEDGKRARFLALLGALEPLAVVPASLFVGLLEVGSQSMQRQIGVPSALVTVIEGLTMLFVLAATARRS